MSPTCTLATRTNGWTRYFAAAYALLLLIGCAAKTPAVSGEVLLLISSDMQVPGSIDTLVVQVDQEEKYIYSAPPATLSRTGVVDPDVVCTDGTVRNEKLALPTTIALLSNSDKPKQVQVTLRACRAGHQVFARTFPVLIPESGQIRMLRAPIRWLCSEKNQRCFGCAQNDTDPVGDGTSGASEAGAANTCSHRQLTLLETSDRCQPPACMVDSSEQFTVIDYIADEVATFVAEPKADSPCISPFRCFEMGAESQFSAHDWTPLATGWATAQSPGSEPTHCIATLRPRQRVPPQYNVALVLPPGEMGFCNRFGCLVQLDANGLVGWKWSDLERLEIELPTAICHMLDTGQILYVAGTVSCPSKPSTLPICDRQDPIPVNEEVSPAHLRTRWDFDNGCEPPSTYAGSAAPQTPFSCVDSLTDQRPDGATTANAAMVSNIAVKGKAGRFNSRQYLRASNSFEMAESDFLSVWVSLSTAPPADSSSAHTVTTAIMPVFSNIPSNCASGVRLQLRACHENSDILVAVGMPTGAKNANDCQLSYSYARLARRSDNGGSFTPWQIGNWYHIGVALGDPDATKIYIDGADANASPIDSTCGLPPSAWQAGDGSLAFVGTEGSLVAVANSAPNEHTSHSADLLIDELEFYDGEQSERVLTIDQIRTILLQSSTWLGASGLRWGTWGTQGGVSQHDWTDTTTRFSVNDIAYSSAGGYALLGDPSSVTQTPTLTPAQDISDFDEAVLVAELPQDSLFQFALVSDHGLRQCTWQLATSALSGPLPYVIDLTRPSWCIDPTCGFDTHTVERVSIGSDWTSPQQSLKYSVTALAFRRRKSDDIGTATGANVVQELGGIIGPDGMCWRGIAYDPRYVVAPLSISPALSPKATVGAVSMAAPAEYPGYTELLSELQQPELAADFMDLYGARDFTQCVSVRLCLALSSKARSNIGVEFVLQNELGHTMTWPIPSSPATEGDCYRSVDLSASGTAWPKELPLDAAKAIKSSVTRFAVRYPGVVVQSAECCNSDGTSCIDIGRLRGESSMP